MNKKIILLCIIIISIFLVFFMAMNYKSSNYEDLVVDDIVWNEIIDSRSITDSNLITSFKFNDYEVLYDYNNCVYYYSLIDCYSNNKNPNIRYKTNKSGAKIVFNKKITDKIIENNEAILVLVYTDNEYSIYNLKCTKLPLLNITLSSVEDIPKDGGLKMNLYLFDNSKSSTNRVINSEGKIHVRGAITSLFLKTGYKISLTMKSTGNNARTNKISLLGMRQDDDWHLYAAYNDQEKVRNVFAMNLWKESSARNNQFNIDNGNEYKFIELFFNNQYWGLYALGSTIDEKQLELDEENEYIFKKNQYNNAEINVFKQETLEMAGYELVNKTNNAEKGWNILKDFFKTLQTSKNKEELYSISDINNLIDYYLFQEFIQANDNARETYLKNVFLTIKKKNNKNVILYTPWDYDMCMGNIYSDTAVNFVLPYYVDVNEKIDFKLNAIGALQNINDPEINNLIKSRYNVLRESYWSNEHLKELISKYSGDIYDSGAFRRDKERWAEGTYNEAEEKLTKFEDYVFKRAEYMDNFIEDLK